MKNALTIAGSDCSGGAGIQADLKTFAAHGVYGMSVITAITAQNTLGITGVYPCNSKIVAEQLLALVSDIKINSIKIGMLYNIEIIECIINILEDLYPLPIVLDPVMVSSTGSTLLEKDAISFMAQKLFPMCSLITPNTDEAQYLSGIKIKTLDDVKLACKILKDMGANNVLIKGGHIYQEEDFTYDTLYSSNKFQVFKHPRLKTKHTHGTGCTLSSAITANLSLGCQLSVAIEKGINYVIDAFSNAFPLGKGVGSANHNVNISKFH